MLIATLPAIAFPAIDPIIVSIDLGFMRLAIRWYALAYVAGLILGWRYVRRYAAYPEARLTVLQVDDFLVWATLAVVLGGRLGYVVFYQAAYFAAHPLEIFLVWQGGMSFHGGLVGVTLALIMFARRHQLPLLRLADAIACAVPIGLFFGRIANFINGELFGRLSDAPWAVVFPAGGPSPRHPSQLYEAALEGLVLFVILLIASRRPSVRARPGTLTGIFCAGYAVARALVELFRQPDAHLGFLFGATTMGQLLSLPLLGFGLFLIWRARPTGARA
ncbi:MAG: prolipoprotein diacylglyceryl transferase [Proteobacteria bacterium]|nr:prolipoprotein diacylglyceryl transferase [Pseudomonadota bacterium]